MAVKLKDGTKLYPVCGWEKNQHKIYNAYDRAIIRREEEGWSDESCEEVERCEKALEAFNGYVRGGVVYATYEEGNVIKDLVAAYDVRGDFLRYCKE